MKRRRLVLVPCPFQGHINPMLHLASLLRSKGFSSITIAHTRFNSPNPSSHPEFTFLPIPDGLPAVKSSSLDDAVSAILRINSSCEAPLRDILGGLMDAGDEIGCLIFDEMMFYVESVARCLKIPAIMLRSSNAATLLARFVVFELNDQGRLPLPDSSMKDSVPDHHPLRLKDLSFPVNSKPAGNFLELMIKKSKMKDFCAIVKHTVDCLEHDELIRLRDRFQVPIFPIGPLHKLVPGSASSTGTSLIQEDTSCIEWLDTQEPKSVLYVSLGSIASMEETELQEMVWGLVNSGQPFLWVIRAGSAEIALPEVSKGKIVKWAPQREVLAHRAVGGFWSHAGWNSTLESISEGVPMICRPSYGDQNVDARYVSQVWRMGLTYEAERLERGEVESIVRRVMVGEEAEEMRRRAKDLKEEVERSVAPGGASYNSVNQLVEFILSF